MTSAEKLKEGLFFISWSSVNSGSANGQVAVANLPDVFESCQLNFINDGQQITLEVNFMLSKTLKPIKLETVSILASMDGNKQKMTFRKTKWVTSWQLPARALCHYCRVIPTVSFDIVIDLNPNSAFTVTNGEKRVLDHNLNLWKTKVLADVTFRCKGVNIKAHTMIVASCSPVLAAMFTDDFQENREKVVDIKDVTHDTFSHLLRFMYIGDASLDSNVSEEEITELLIAADKYGVEALKEDCGLHLSSNLKVENASKFLVLAHHHNSNILLESTFDFISKNAKAVCSRKDWLDVIKNYPELCFQATQLMFGL